MAALSSISSHLSPAFQVVTGMTSEKAEPKVDIHAMDPEGCTALYRAIEQNSHADIDRLLSEGASVFVGASAFPFILQDVSLCLRLLGIKSDHPLGKCKNFHEISQAIRPRCKKLNEKMMQAVLTKVKPSEAMGTFVQDLPKGPLPKVDPVKLMEAIAEKCKKKFPETENKESAQEDKLKFLEKTCSEAPFSIIQEALAELHSTFRVARVCSNRLASKFSEEPKPLQLLECLPGKAQSGYDIGAHRYEIQRPKSFKDLVWWIIFATLYSLNRETMLHFNTLVPGRESYAILQTKAEFEIRYLTQVILDSIFSPKKPIQKKDYLKFWNEVQLSLGCHGYIMVQRYRNLWDCIYFTKYWGDKQADLLKRLEKLHNPKLKE